MEIKEAQEIIRNMESEPNIEKVDVAFGTILNAVEDGYVLFQGFDRILDNIAETLVLITENIFYAFCEFGKYVVGIPNMIKSMSEKEFESMCASLTTIESKELARRIRESEK